METAEHIRSGGLAGAPLQLLFERLGNSPVGGTGAWRFGAESGPAGLVFIERGSICWAATPDRRYGLANLLSAEANVPRRRIAELLIRCRQERRRLGAEIVREGLVSADKFRELLRKDTCEALVMIAALQPRAATWTQHRGAGYSPDVTLTLIEAFASCVALSAGIDPRPAEEHLASMLQGGGIGVVMRQGEQGPLPVAASSEEMSLEDGQILATWAHDALQSAGRISVGPRLVFGAVGVRAAAAWRHGPWIGAALLSPEAELPRLVAQYMRLSKGGR